MKNRKFVYQPRTVEQVKERANMQSNNFDSPFKPGIKFYKVRDGKNRIRILPPTWENAGHHGFDIHINYGVGADSQKYLSLSKMLKQPDPLEEAMKQAEREGDKETARALKPTYRVGMWVIDRLAEAEGPQFFLSPFTLDRAFIRQSYDEDSGSRLMLDSPDEGYDITFLAEGQGQNRKYPGESVRIAREPTPISPDDKIQDQWLDYITEHPIPDCLVYHNYEQIKATFDGHVSLRDEENAAPRQAKQAKATTAPSQEEDADEEVDDEPTSVGKSIRERLLARAAQVEEEPPFERAVRR